MEDLSVLDLPENVFCSTVIYTYLAFVPQVFPVVCKFYAIVQIQAKKCGTIKGIGFFGCRNFIQLSFPEEVSYWPLKYNGINDGRVSLQGVHILQTFVT